MNNISRMRKEIELGTRSYAFRLVCRYGVQTGVPEILFRLSYPARHSCAEAACPFGV